MIKFVVRSPLIWKRMAKIPIIRRFFVLRMSSFPLLDGGTIEAGIWERSVQVNGTVKTTYHGRFKDLDEWLLTQIQGGTELSIHDVAVSTGITSLEFKRYLEAAGIDTEFYISDIYSEVTIVGNSVACVYDASGSLLAVYLGCFFGEKNASVLFPFSRLFYTLGYLLGRYIKQQEMQSVSLYHPKVRVAIDYGQIREIKFDAVSGGSVGPFDLVRAMNILHTGYFPERKIAIGIKNMAKTLSEGGYLLLGRSDFPRLGNHASLYQKLGSMLVQKGRYGNGYELEGLVENLMV